MSTYLQLCQALRRECGVSGSGPTTVVNQTGEMGRLVGWIAQAWLEIALLHPEWRFLLKDASFVTVQGQRAYPYASAPLSLTDFGAWKRQSFRRYLTATPASEHFLEDMAYDNFRDYYLFSSRRTEQGDPISITVDPTSALQLGSIPNSTDYTVVGQYFAAPTELAIDADTPAAPARFHMAIVYKAMMKYGAFEAAPEVYQRGENEYKAMLRRLEADQLEMPCIGGPLA